MKLVDVHRLMSAVKAADVEMDDSGQMSERS